jgi:hypothetical protein
MLLIVKRGREADVERVFEKWDLHAVDRRGHRGAGPSRERERRDRG